MAEAILQGCQQRIASYLLQQQTIVWRQPKGSASDLAHLSHHKKQVQATSVRSIKLAHPYKTRYLSNIRFTLQHDDRLFELQASDESECDQWLEVLKFLKYLSEQIGAYTDRGSTSAQSFF